LTIAGYLIYLQFKTHDDIVPAGRRYRLGGGAERKETGMKVVVDRAKCTGLGICESLAPDFFEVDDNGELVQRQEEVGPEELAAVEEAVRGCPTEALRIVH
jgi:ferredoxin